MLPVTVRFRGYTIKPVNVQTHSKKKKKKNASQERATRFHFTSHHIGFPPRPQMKEESAYVPSALRTALRIYNPRRITGPGAFKTNPPVVVRENSPERDTHRHSRLTIRPANTHYSVVLRCLHRHLEQSRAGCLLWERRQPCPPQDLVCQRRGTDWGG